MSRDNLPVNVPQFDVPIVYAQVNEPQVNLPEDIMSQEDVSQGIVPQVNMPMRPFASSQTPKNSWTPPPQKKNT